MKNFLLPVLLLVTAVRSFAELKFVRCVSGDCRNGAGQAVFIDPAWSTPGEYTYTGTFKDGQMDGEGTLVSNIGYFTGSFEKGRQVGYGIAFTSKKVAGVNVPDSDKWVNIGRWDDDGSMHCVQVHEDGNTGYYNTEGAGEHSKHFHPYAEVKDKWVKMHVAEYLAAMGPVFAERKRVHDSMFPPQVLVDHHMTVHAQSRIATARGKLERLITWDCTSARKYFVTASAVERGKLTTMPFGGFVRYQVRSDEDDKVLWEGAADEYWHPQKDGKYRFLIIFDAKVIGGTPPEGAYLEWSLRSETL